MTSPRLVLLLLLCVLPIQVLAQVSAPEGDAPVVTTPPPLVPAPTEPEEASEPSEEVLTEGPARGELIPREPRPDPWKAGRVTLEALGGLLLGTAGLLPGGYLALEAAFCECSNQNDDFLLGLGLASFGLATGAALGVTGAGSLLGGEGRFLPTFLGGGLGLLGGVLGAVLVGALAGPALFIPLLVGPVAGAIIGFERSHAEALAMGQAPTASTLQVMPLLTRTPRGGILGGLVARF